MALQKTKTTKDMPVLLENRDMTMYAVLSASLSLNLLLLGVLLASKA